MARDRTHAVEPLTSHSKQQKALLKRSRLPHAAVRSEPAVRVSHRAASTINARASPITAKPEGELGLSKHLPHLIRAQVTTICKFTCDRLNLVPKRRTRHEVLGHSPQPVQVASKRLLASSHVRREVKRSAMVVPTPRGDPLTREEPALGQTSSERHDDSPLEAFANPGRALNVRPEPRGVLVIQEVAQTVFIGPNGDVSKGLMIVQRCNRMSGFMVCNRQQPSTITARTSRFTSFCHFARRGTINNPDERRLEREYRPPPREHRDLVEM